MSRQWSYRILIDPDIHHGEPCVRGTRIPVSMIVGSLADGITFTYEFSDTIHRRAIELDNYWKIILDRGLDFFQKPESKYELSEVDQTKRKCRKIEIIYIK
jgi:ATP-dependent Lon protease